MFVFVTAVYDVSLWASLAVFVAALPETSKLYVWCAADTAVPTEIAESAAVVICTAPLTDFACYVAGSAPGLALPETRNPAKDTAAYLAFVNSKPEMVAKAAVFAGEPTASYVWLDADASNMWNGDVVDMGRALRRFTRACIPSGTFVAPGCWDLSAGCHTLPQQPVCWRYCGTSFAVAGDSVQDICKQLSDRYLAVVAGGCSTWEVNVWAQLETDMRHGLHHGPRFGWFRADHNATLLNFPHRVDLGTQVVIRKTTCDGLGNVLKGFMSLRRIHDDVAVQCAPEYMYGTYDTVLRPEAVYHNDSTCGRHVEFAYTCRLLVLRDEEDEQSTIPNEYTSTDGCGNADLNTNFSRSVLIDWNYDVSKLAPRLVKDVVRTVRLIPWHPTVTAAVDKYWTLLTEGRTGRNVLSVSVRTWRASHEWGVNRPYAFTTYAAAIRGAVERMAGAPPDLALLSIDVPDVDVWHEYTTLLQSELGVPTAALNGPGPGGVSMPDLNPLQTAAVKMLLLAKGTVLVASRISTYSELIFWCSECHMHVIGV